jgi:hypothetical protein
MLKGFRLGLARWVLELPIDTIEGCICSNLGDSGLLFLDMGLWSLGHYLTG